MTDAPAEVEVAILLGLDPGQAARAVVVLQERELLWHGVAVVGAAVASRWGVELPDALRRLADRKPHGEGFSDYELRVASEEAESEVIDALQRLRADPQLPEQARALARSAITERNGGSGDGSEATAVQVSSHHIDPRRLAGD